MSIDARIDSIGTENSKLVIVGWFIGLAYFNWFSSAPISVQWWAHAILIVGGMFVASIVIGGGIAVLIGVVINKAGWSRRSGTYLKAGGLISAVLAFFAARYGLLLFQFFS